MANGKHKSALTTTVELRVQGASATQFLTQALVEGESLRIGRAPQSGFAIPWDPMISREHADLNWNGERLRVTCTDSARNPLLVANQTVRAADLVVGQQFRLGSTVFTVAWPRGSGFKTVDLEFDTEVTSVGSERAYSAEDLHNVRFGDAPRQLEILAKLPALISNSQPDAELAVTLAHVLLEAISGAECVAVAQFDLEKLVADAELDSPLMLRVDTRDEYQGRFRPSRRLIAKSLEKQQSLIHVWDGGMESQGFTLSDGLGWAFCTPIRGESCQGWCLYVSGKTSIVNVGEEALKSDLRFTELVAQFIGSIRQVRLLQEQKTQLATFFSPKVIESLTGRAAADALKPAERDVSVLFCDVRGFSRKSELLAHDLQLLLKSVREALGVMSKGILDSDGTIADFQGDAALAFWGWPVELAEGPIPACRAAIAILRGFQAGTNDPASLLSGFSVGIGIVHGRAIAGQIGTAKQAKVGVFGPVVNQGSRLEGLTKQLGVPICIDEATADWAKRILPPDVSRVRRLARVRPLGMSSPINVYQLLPTENREVKGLETLLVAYDAALDAVIGGNWRKALEILARLDPSDGPTQFLLRQMSATDNALPANWDGTFNLTTK